jgi:hypothetical protein
MNISRRVAAKSQGHAAKAEFLAKVSGSWKTLKFRRLRKDGVIPHDELGADPVAVASRVVT